MKDQEPNAPRKMSKAQLADIRALATKDINTADIPEAPAEHWRRARRFLTPRKKAGAEG